MLYPEHLKEEIKLRTDIVTIIRRYVSLKKAGSSYKGLCPFHKEKTPSFTVTPSKNIFHCFGCGKGGDAFTFLMEIEQYGFAEAYKVLAQEAGIDLSKYEGSFSNKEKESNPIFSANQFALSFFYKSLKQNKTILDYFKKRGILVETIDKFKLGYAPTGWNNLINSASNEGIKVEDLDKAGLVSVSSESKRYYDRFRERIIFPIYNLSGMPVAFGGRILNSDKTLAKYINSPETSVYKKSSVLYGLFASRSYIRDNEFAILVEGYMDYHALFQAGIKNVVASSGTALTNEQAGILKRYTQKIFVVFDADNAGIKAAERGVNILTVAGLEVKICVLPQGEDPDSFVTKNGATAFNDALSKSDSYIDFKLKRYILKYGNKTPESIGKIVSEITKDIAIINNEIVRAEYIKRIENTLRIKSGVISKSVYALLKPSNKNRTESNIVKATNGKYRDERDILGLIIANPNLASKAKILEETPDVWGHISFMSFFKTIMKVISISEEKGLEAPDFIENIELFKKREQTFITNVLSKDEQSFMPEKWDEFMVRLFKKYYGRKKVELRNQMEVKGADRRKLTIEFNNIVKREMEILKNGKVL